MVHSGSRHTGLRIADHYAHEARAITARRGLEVPPELWSLPLDDDAAQDYLHDMEWATSFALENRYRMLEAMLHALGMEQEEVGGRDAFINIHHNFARREEHGGQEMIVHRKGATSARAGELGIIPGSMGAPSYIVRGRGNPESFVRPAPTARDGGWGATRPARRSTRQRSKPPSPVPTPKTIQGVLGRGAAGVQGRHHRAGRQTDLVEVVHTLRPIVTVKGDSRAKED